ncbi:MAG: DUF4168 domain-containing protein [Spirochaetota bacterium]
MVVLAVLVFAAVPFAFAQSSGDGGDDGSGPGADQGGPDVSVSEDELESFAAALQEVQVLRQEMAEETQQMVNDSELGQQRFEDIYRSEQGGTELDEEPTDTENEQFEALMSDIQELQQASNEEMVEVVEEEGLSVNRFNEIAQAIQQDPELQQQFQQMQGQGSGGSGS